MQRSDFEFELPSERIAQRPVEPRDAARMLVHERGSDTTRHRHVRELAEELRAGDLLVVNDTRVLPARLWAKRGSGGAVELLFVEPTAEPGRWRALVRPAKKPRPGEVLGLEGGLEVELLMRENDAGGRAGALWQVALRDPGDPARSVDELLERAGEMPLPPYIQRERGGHADDRDRYQTVYADKRGAVAAPTAGLHFTRSLLTTLEQRGVERVSVTLHVGLGTFQPIQVEDLDQHVMHSERLEVSQAVVDAVQRCRTRGGRVIAVGTTSVRALESASASGELQPLSGSTRLFIQPGYRFRVVDGLLTNYHLPGSTLLMLVSALAGREKTLALYAEALQRGYRFYSYGDAMLLLP